jgi:opacity protein-like surface antigen
VEKKRFRTCILLTAALWLVTVAATRAVERGFYIGIAGGQTSFGLPQHQVDANLSTALSLDPRFEFAGRPSQINSQIDTHASGLSGLVGYRINRGLAVEAAYVDLGSLTYRASGTGATFDGDQLIPVDFSARLNTDVTGTAVSLLASLFPPGRWEVFLRGGVLFAQTKPSFHASTSSSTGQFDGELGPGSESSTDLLAGVGTTLHFTDRWAARLEYERFLGVGASAVTENDISLVSLGILVHF